MITFITKGKNILGMNARNLRYIRPYNLKRAMRLADNKIISKRVLKNGGIPVPKLLAKISTQQALDRFDWAILPPSFALKPNRGIGGEGILVVYGKKKGTADVWVRADGSPITVEDFKAHVSNILDGTFSLSDQPDIAFFEERLRLHKVFRPYAFRGIPDVRVVVYNKVPVMAMLRLPTKESGGKANLQQGAVGVGIDLATGVTTSAVQGKMRLIEYVPGTRMLLSGIKIPYWQDILLLAIRAQELSGVGFLGADIAIDRDRGPVFLELNARPGLSIQIANLSGLQRRLERVSGLKITSPERGVRVGMSLFGGEIEESMEGASGKKVIGTTEKVRLFGKNGIELDVEAKIDTGAGFSSIDTELAKNLGFEKTITAYNKLVVNYEQLRTLSKEKRMALFKDIPDLADTAIIHSSHGTSYRPMVSIDILMDTVRIPAKVSLIDRANLKFPVIIGKRNLGKFLVDVSK